MLASRDDLSIVLDNVADGVTVQDRSGRLVYANIAAARVLGVATQQELLATPTAEILRRFEVFDEDGRPLPLDRLPGRRALEGEAEGAVTIQFRPLPAGEDRWSRVRATPIPDVTGHPAYAVNVWHDVTDQKRTEHRQRFLMEAGEQLASAPDVEAALTDIAGLAVPGLADWCAVHLVRRDGSLDQLVVEHTDPERTAWARQLQERYPPDPDAAHGVPYVIRTAQPELISDVTDEMLVAAARDEEHLAIARRVGMRSAMIAPIVGRDRVLGAISFVTAESGRRYGQQDLDLLRELARRAAMALDNAQLYGAERAARTLAEDAHLRFRALFEGIPDAILVLDDDEIIIDANAGACELLGYDGEELIFLPVGDLIPQAGDDRAAATLARLDEWRGATEVRRRDGELVPVELWFRKLELPSGTVRIGAMRDISERRAADRAREEVLAAVSHDLRNPIGVIKAHVQLLLRMLDRGKAPEGEQLRERLAAIDAMGSRMALLLDDMTDVARSRRGETLEIDRAPTDLVALARRNAAEMAATARDVHVEAEAPELVGHWDARGVERVIHNLVHNALKYSPEGGRVDVRIRRVEDPGGAWAELVVLDEGIGIPEGDRQRIFDPYYRGSNVGRISGTGVGLAGARNIVEAQGGTIASARRDPRGTAMTVRLPLTNPDAAPGLEGEVTAAPVVPPSPMPETPAPPG
jgi:PAS domain S-box-containing protein